MLTLNLHPLVSSVEPIDPRHLIGDLVQPSHPLFGVVWINRERVSGTPCFYATRVPIKALFDSLEAGETLDQFLDDFEGVKRDQAIAVLRLAENGLWADLPSS